MRIGLELRQPSHRLTHSAPPGGEGEPLHGCVPGSLMDEHQPRAESVSWGVGRMVLAGLCLGAGLVGCATVRPIPPPEVAVAPMDTEAASVAKRSTGCWSAKWMRGRGKRAMPL